MGRRECIPMWQRLMVRRRRYLPPPRTRHLVRRPRWYIRHVLGRCGIHRHHRRAKPSRNRHRHGTLHKRLRRSTWRHRSGRNRDSPHRRGMLPRTTCKRYRSTEPQDRSRHGRCRSARRIDCRDRPSPLGTGSDLATRSPHIPLHQGSTHWDSAGSNRTTSRSAGGRAAWWTLSEGFACVDCCECTCLRRSRTAPEPRAIIIGGAC